MGEFFLNELVNAKGVGYGVNNLTVILMGLGVVFAGLIGLIIVCSIMGSICKRVIKESPQIGAPTARCRQKIPLYGREKIILPARIFCYHAQFHQKCFNTLLRWYR